MTVLTDDECRDIYNDAMAMPERSVVQTMRVIEAAVISKLAAGFGDEPTYFSEGHTAEQLGAAYAAGAAAQLGVDNAEISARRRDGLPG